MLQVGNDIVIAIAGNKSDLEKNRQVEISAAEEYARSVGAVHFSTSAKTLATLADAKRISNRDAAAT